MALHIIKKHTDKPPEAPVAPPPLPVVHTNRGGRINWRKLAAEYIAENAKGDKPFTYLDLATRHGVAPGTVRNKAMREKWHEQAVAQKAAVSARAGRWRSGSGSP